MASLWRLPLLVVLENNRYAQTTPLRLNLAGDIPARFRAFGIPAVERGTTDVLEVHAMARDLAGEVRGGGGPRALVIDTYRFAPHSKGDDTRDPAEIEHHRKADPLLVHGRRLDSAVRAVIEAEVEAEVGEAFRRAEAARPADPESLTPALEPAR
jgi:TPP-dependent pyruvate/acetoin dehydrogenase alpha subunit